MTPRKELLYARWVIVQGDAGLEVLRYDCVFPHLGCETIVPSPDSIRDLVESYEVYSIDIYTGWGARYRNGEYLSPTPWKVYASKHDAEQSKD